ncbi:unnamed protein product, partial [Rotaria sp. Silwood2]
METEKDWFIDRLPKLKHLILSWIDLPTTESHLIDILNKSIQQLDIDTDRVIQPLATTNYIYFSNVMHINFNCDCT